MSCDIERCDHGWVTVLPSYADRHAPQQPSADVWDRMSAKERETWETNTAAAWLALSETVYPCRMCQPDAFYRWVQGHWSSDHDRDRCEICQEEAGSKPAMQHAATPVASVPPRRDLE